jgi:hypothetical protein
MTNGKQCLDIACSAVMPGGLFEGTFNFRKMKN